MSIETWTPERVEQLRHFVVNGLSCSQIAAEIGVTRNAVIGKIHRLGLSSAHPPGASGRSCPPRPRPRRASSHSRLMRLMFSEGEPLTGATKAPAPIESTQPCSLLDLVNGKCRWPLEQESGDRRAGDLLFCANQSVPGLPYCTGHARMAYRLPARRSA